MPVPTRTKPGPGSEPRLDFRLPLWPWRCRCCLGSPPAATANHPPRSRSLTPPTPSPAERAVDETLANLRLSRADVAQLVGGIGIANVMVIGALERRTLIGVRRALGAIAGLSPAARAARLAPAGSLRPT
jgi:hypothetical protein